MPERVTFPSDGSDEYDGPPDDYPIWNEECLSGSSSDPDDLPALDDE